MNIMRNRPTFRDPGDLNKPLKMRWVMISFAFMATVINYLHRLSFNYLAADGYLKHILPDDAFGYIGTAFFLAYMVSNGFSGFVIDRLGTRLGYSICMAFWTTAGILHCVARTPLQFGFFRFLLGVGEAGNWPAAIKMTGEWFPPEERSTASGIFNSGAAAGAIFAPPIIAYFGTTFGWQATFVVIGILGYLWLAAFWFTYYTPERVRKESTARIIPPKLLFKTPYVRWFVVLNFLIDPIWYFITFWIARYLAEVHHWNLAKIGVFAVLPFIISDSGNLLGGYFTQFIIKRGVAVPKARKISTGFCCSLIALSLILGPFLITGPGTALAVIGTAGFGYASYSANSLAFTPDVMPKSATASVSGIANVGSGLGGAFFQAITGVAIKGLSARFSYATAYGCVFIGYGIMALLAMYIVLFRLGALVPNKELHDYVEKAAI
jgi:MFS transporter, ACS family, hexuronate transporter